MLRKEPERQQSFYCVLYDKIPEDHILKKVSNVAGRQGTVLCLD